MKYALDRDRQPDKAIAFELALGYTRENAEELRESVWKAIQNAPATFKGDKGYGSLYECIFILAGRNGKTAKVLTGWVQDELADELRLVTIHVDDRKERSP